MDLAIITIFVATATLLLLAALMAYLLGTASKALHVPVDVRMAQVHAALPGANCGSVPAPPTRVPAGAGPGRAR